MSDSADRRSGSEGADARPRTGAIVWHDLTVPDADEVRRFYREVVGWASTGLSMGDYEDYVMMPPGADSGDGVAGICHARGSNAGLPPQWLIYVTVESVERSAQRCVELGGKVIDGPRPMGGRAFCVVQDPAGAVLALIEP